MVTARTAIENFEDTYGDDAVLDYQKLRQPPRNQQITQHEIGRRIREARCKWIIENRKTDYLVHDLINLIQNHVGKINSQNFCYGLSIAYNELTQELKSRLLKPRGDKYDFENLTLNEEADEALKIFLSLFQFKKMNVVKVDKITTKND